MHVYNLYIVICLPSLRSNSPTHINMCLTLVLSPPFPPVKLLAFHYVDTFTM